MGLTGWLKYSVAITQFKLAKKNELNVKKKRPSGNE